MKTKKLLAIIAPAMLLASCGGGNKTTTTISKININTNAKTLIMGKLTNSTVTANDDEEQLITVDDEGNATETEVEVTTGNKTTETKNITISRLVKLNKEYAVVSCTYNDVTYDLIVNLTDGTCVKFPDSSLLPNSKEKLGGHKAYRKYHKKYGYLNNTVVQPNEDVKLFYYVNHYQCDASDETVYAKRLVVLDLTGETPSARAIVTPSEKHSVQTFAVDNGGNVVYMSSINEKITGDDPSSQFDPAKLHYDDNKEDVVVTFDDEKYDYIAPTLITGSDSLIYCYLKVKDNAASNFVMASIDIEEEGETVKATANPVQSEGEQTLETYPEKIFTVKGTDSGSTNSVINTVSVTKNDNKINQLFSFTKTKKYLNEFSSKSFGDNKPKPTPTPSPWKKKAGDKPESKKIEGTEELTTIEDGFSGNNYSYLFGQISGESRRHLKRIKYEDSTYEYVDSILESYFNNLTANIAEAETDESTDDITVVVEDGSTETVVVVDQDATGEKETVVENVTDVSDVVDIND